MIAAALSGRVRLRARQIRCKGKGYLWAIASDLDNVIWLDKFLWHGASKICDRHNKTVADIRSIQQTHL